MLLLEAARQAAHSTHHPHPSVNTSIDAQFTRFVELDTPCWIEAQPTPTTTPGHKTVHITTHQNDTTPFTATITSLVLPPFPPTPTPQPTDKPHIPEQAAHRGVDVLDQDQITAGQPLKNPVEGLVEHAGLLAAVTHGLQHLPLDRLRPWWCRCSCRPPPRSGPGYGTARAGPQGTRSTRPGG
ncbi:AfsA-related hotdog domain-containing protein [Streptomyces sp. NPDC101133]|uniref:AfsA-related hotdog domain-containing protein n=1 Tax=Streptomyces sp. NPDC101133 TaxID=3366111 RepID=UPI0038111DEE